MVSPITTFVTCRRSRGAIGRFVLTLLLVGLLCFTYPVGVRAQMSQPSPERMVQRLEKIKQAMGRIHFCYNENCFYRNIESKIEPPQDDKGAYTATISAVVDRPSAVLDTADYHLVFKDNRWRLLKGEEYTDVADYVFEGDRYEIYSIHTNRAIQGNLTQAKADGNLKSGYLPVYYDVLDKGVERP